MTRRPMVVHRACAIVGPATLLACTVLMTSPALAAVATPRGGDAASPTKSVAALAGPSCTDTVVARGNGVRIRTAPNLDAAIVGQAYSGDRFTANCYTVLGSAYTACGFTEAYWVELKFDGSWRYSAAACYLA